MRRNVALAIDVAAAIFNFLLGCGNDKLVRGRVGSIKMI